MTSIPQPSPIMRAYLLFGLFAFLLNFVWESWHAVYLYIASNTESLAYVGSYKGFVALITRVSLVDALILVVILIGGAIVWKSPRWWVLPTPRQYAYIICVAVVWAAVIEYHGLSTNRWQYSELMPTVFGLGVSPLVQLAITGISAMYLARLSRDLV